VDFLSLSFKNGYTKVSRYFCFAGSVIQALKNKQTKVIATDLYNPLSPVVPKSIPKHPGPFATNSQVLIKQIDS